MASRDLIDLDFSYSPTASSNKSQSHAQSQQIRSSESKRKPLQPNTLDVLNQNPAPYLHGGNPQKTSAFNVVNDDDDFGDFESGTQIESRKGEVLTEAHKPFPELAAESAIGEIHDQRIAGTLVSRGSHAPVARDATPSLPIQQAGLRSLNLRDDSRDGHAGAAPKKAIRAAPKIIDENVLFDADDAMSDDDFGDFEAPPVSHQAKPAQELRVQLAPIELRTAVINPPQRKASAPSLLDLDDSDTQWTASTHTDATSSSTKHHAPRAAVQPAQSKPGVVQTTRSQGNGAGKAIAQTERALVDEAWDDFEETTPKERVLPRASINTHEMQSDNFDAWDDFNETDVQPSSTSVPFSTSVPLPTKSSSQPTLHLPILLPNSLVPPEPPTYVPPPVVLISIFAPIFQTVSVSLLDPLSALPRSGPERSVILRHESTQDFLKSFLMVSNALGRIIAGRRLRWKRDTLLSQSLRIRPVDSGGAKPTGVYKSEGLKEDGEVEEVIQAWRAIVGRLKYTVVAAGLKAHIPEIGDNMPARPAEQREGGSTAPRPCSVCGLKRKERVAKVDVNVQDNFGEWWIEHWGHRDCTLTWLNYKDSLRDG